MRQDFKVILITLIIFAAIIGVLMLGTDATQVETHQCDPDRTCAGCNAVISKPSSDLPYSLDAAK